MRAANGRKISPGASVIRCAEFRKGRGAGVTGMDAAHAGTVTDIIFRKPIMKFVVEVLWQTDYYAYYLPEELDVVWEAEVVTPDELQREITGDPEIGFFQRIINWFKNLFRRD